MSTRIDGRLVPRHVVRQRKRHDKAYVAGPTLVGNRVVVHRGTRSYALPYSEHAFERIVSSPFDWQTRAGAERLALALCLDTHVRPRNLSVAWCRVHRFLRLFADVDRWTLDEPRLRRIIARGLFARRAQKNGRPGTHLASDPERPPKELRTGL